MLNKFEDIAQKVREDIKSGKYSSKLPSEQALAQIYQTTHVTASKALNLLRTENIVIREQGRGSFINPEFFKSQDVIYDFPKNNEIYIEVLDVLKKLFPNLKFQKSKGSNQYGRMMSCDLSIQVSHLPFSYEKYFSPIPEEYIIEIQKSEKYYSDTLLTHRGENLYYGIPVIFSPIVLIYNKSLFKKLGNISMPTILNYEYLLKLESELKSKKKFLFSTKAFRYSTVMSYIFSNRSTTSLDSPSTPKTDLGTISNGLNKMEALFRRGIENNADFKNGDVLFSYICRQSINRLQKYDLDFTWDICPLPEEAAGCRPIASESVFISANSVAKELLRDVANHFISAEIQNIFSREKYGIPILKSAAIDSLENTSYRDDFFFTEAKKCSFNYEFLHQSLLGTFMLLNDKYFNNEISAKEYHKDTCDLYRLHEMSLKNEMSALELNMI